MNKSPRDLSIRRQAYQIYVRTRNISETARQLNLKRHTIYCWAVEDAWEQRLDDIQHKLEFHLDAVKRFDDNQVLRLYFQELKVLDYLQEQISEAFIVGEIQPKTWADLIKTQKFIFERRETLLGLLGDPEAKDKINEAVKKVDELTKEDAKRYLHASITDKEGAEPAKIARDGTVKALPESPGSTGTCES